MIFASCVTYIMKHMCETLSFILFKVLASYDFSMSRRFILNLWHILVIHESLFILDWLWLLWTILLATEVVDKDCQITWCHLLTLTVHCEYLLFSRKKKSIWFIWLFIFFFSRSFGFDGKGYTDGGSSTDSGVAGTGSVDSAGVRRNPKVARKRTAMTMTNGDCGGASPILPGPSAITRRRLEFE